MTPLALACFGSLLLQEGAAFRAPEPAPPGSFAVVERRGRGVAVDLGPELPGIPAGTGRFRFPFADPVDRVEVLVSAGGAGRTGCTVIVAGGVRSALAFHVLRAGGGRVSIEFAGARLLDGFFRPLVDRHAAVLACLFEDPRGVQLRVLSVLGRRPALLLARRLAGPPPTFRLRAVLGDPRVGVYLGGVAVEAPGEAGFRAAASLPRFLHPLAALPAPSVTRLDFGTLDRGARVQRDFDLANPGRLPLRLLLRARVARGWELDVGPPSVTLAPGGRQKVVVTLACDEPPSRLAARLEVDGSSGEGEPLAQVSLVARRIVAEDRTPPTLDPKLVARSLLPRRRAKLAGARGAVRDETGPCTVGDTSGATARVAADGSFTLEVPLPLDGRVFLWTRDGRGNRSRPRYVATIRDENPPQVAPEAIVLGLPVRGWTEVRGRAGAVRDETPPLGVEVWIDGERYGTTFPVAADGSFRIRVPARPGQRVRLVVLDGSASFHRSPPLELGRVFPYVARAAGVLVLHGPAGATFRVVPAVAAKGRAPETPLRTLVGQLDGRGEARLEKRKLAGATLLRFAVRVATTGRVLVGRFAIE